MRRYQFNLKSLLIATFVVACVTCTTIVGANRTKRNMEATRSAYGAQLVAYMCVEHMKANNQSWPTSWEEIDDDLVAGYARSGQKWTWTGEELKRRVSVNWNPDLGQIKANSTLKPVAWISDFPNRKHYMTSPNEIVSRYLNSVNFKPK